jgi:hypothetical protein
MVGGGEGGVGWGQEIFQIYLYQASVFSSRVDRQVEPGRMPKSARNRLVSTADPEGRGSV